MLLLQLAFLPQSRAATLTVDPSGAYHTIASAIAAASDGDEIDIVAGTWYECVDPNGKNVAFVGTSGSAATIVDGGGVCQYTLTVDSGETAVSVTGMSFTNNRYGNLYLASGLVTLDDVNVSGGGSSSFLYGNVWVTGAAVDISDSTITAAAAGPNVEVTAGGTLTMTDCSVTDGASNAIVGDGTGGAVDLTLSNVFVDGNTGTAAYLRVDGTLVSEGSIYSNNGGGANIQTGTFLSTADTFESNDSHGVNVANATVTLYDPTILYNSTSDGGGVALSGATVTVDGGRIAGNYGSVYGGGFYLTNYASLTLDGVDIDGNGSGYGGGAYVSDHSSLVDGGSTWTDNSGVGGAVYALSSGTVSLTGSTLSSNTSSSDGTVSGYDSGALSLVDCVFDDNQGANGGALYGHGVSALTVSGSVFTGNTASSGGAIYAMYADDVSVSDSTFDSNAASSGGGAIYVFGTGTLTVADSSFTSNTANLYHGGAICSAGTGDPLALTITGSTFDSNASNADGGAISGDALSIIHISQSTFKHNSAGTSGSGGAINATLTSAYPPDGTDPSFLLDNSRFCGNEADIGGAFYSDHYRDSDATISWTNNIFQENRATTDGGGVYFASAVGVDFRNNTVVGNSAGTSGGGLYFYSTTGTVLNNIFAYTAAGDGVYAADATSGTLNTFTYNDFYSNIAADRSGLFVFPTTGFGNTTSDPGFVAYTLDGNCENDDLALASASALVDAGSPSYLDLDGSPSDLGAYGGTGAAYIDADADTYPSDIDCDDSDSSVGAMRDWYPDADGDGHGAATGGVTACVGPSGYAADAEDCDDTDASVSPAAPEVAYDGVDQDCSGADLTDVDGDGYDSTAVGGRDCNDLDAAVSPAAPEVWYDGVDADCDGASDYDQDGDGHDVTTDPDGTGDDCDDTAASVHPGARDTPYDGVDTDCSGGSDNDADGDGHDAIGHGGDDCDDARADVAPGIPERCDGVDQDCDDAIDDDATDAATWYADTDEDGFGDAAAPVRACSAPANTVSDSSDCDDTAAAVHPGATEVCDANETDENCNGLADDEDPEVSVASETTTYADADADGYGAGSPTVSCHPPSESVTDDMDCDDGDPAVHPDAVELCGNDADDDCDPATSDTCPDTSSSGDDTAGDTANDPGEEHDTGTAEKSGCGCSTTTDPSSVVWGLALGIGLITRRRRPV